MPRWHSTQPSRGYGSIREDGSSFRTEAQARRDAASGDASDGGGSGNRAKERERAWSAPGRGTSYQPTPLGNNRQYGRQQPASGQGITAACTSCHIRLENISADADPAMAVVAVAATGGGPQGVSGTSRMCPLPDFPLSTNMIFKIQLLWFYYCYRNRIVKNNS
jgi:hypothetical protein